MTFACLEFSIHVHARNWRSRSTCLYSKAYFKSISVHVCMPYVSCGFLQAKFKCLYIPPHLFAWLAFFSSHVLTILVEAYADAKWSTEPCFPSGEEGYGGLACVVLTLAMSEELGWMISLADRCLHLCGLGARALELSKAASTITCIDESLSFEKNCSVCLLKYTNMLPWAPLGHQPLT